MEALLEKEADVESWNDERMDELSRRVDNGFNEMRAGFARVDKEMKEGFGRVDVKFDKLADRIDKFFYLQLAFMGSLVVGLLTLVAGVLTKGI